MDTALRFVHDFIDTAQTIGFLFLGVAVVFWVIPMTLGYLIDRRNGTAADRNEAAAAARTLNVFQIMFCISVWLVGFALMLFVTVAFVYSAGGIGRFILPFAAYMLMQYAWRRLRHLPHVQRNFSRRYW